MSRLIAVFIGVIAVSYKGFCQCATANAGTDKLYCSSTAVSIGTSTVSGYSYSWSPGTGLSNPNIAQPNASPSVTTTYTLTQLGANMLTNGGFEDYVTGPSGYNSDYSWSNDYPSYGEFTWNFDFTFPPCEDPVHGGNFCLSGHPYASSGSNYRLWYVTVNITANNSYRFSGFTHSDEDGPYNFQVRFLGNVSGTSTSSFTSSPYCNGWQNFSADWTAGSSDTQVTLEIRLTSTGNYMVAFDDLFFGCKSTDDVVVQVGGTPTVIPGGPIVYYKQHETANSIDLTYLGIPPGTGTWYKNNVSTGATGAKYTVSFSGNTTYTDNYKVRSACGTYSNSVSFTYIGCDADADYPVSITHGGCASTMTSPNYIQLNAPSLGQGTTYSYWLYHNPSNYSITSNGRLTGTSPWGSDGVYVKSAKNGAEVYMFYTILANTGCRMANPKGSETGIKTEVAPLLTQTTLAPNPASDLVRISSKNKIEAIEFYDMLGLRRKNISVNEGSTIFVNISDLVSGMYTVRILTTAGAEVTKLIIQSK